jgi:hypothetical protein
MTKKSIATTLFAIAACHAAPKDDWHAVEPGEDSCPPLGSDEGALGTGRTRRPVCAPVVSLACAITLPCAVGTPRADGAFDVTATPNQHIVAHLRRYCEGPRCFPALLTRDLDCDGCGEPKPAETTCHFDADRCVP